MQNILKEHLPLLLICLFYMVGNDILSIHISGLHPEFDFYPLTTILLYILKFYFAASVCLAGFVAVYFITYSLTHYRTRPFWSTLWLKFKRQFLSRQQIFSFILIFLLVPVFFAFIAMYKQLLPFVHPFAWDKTFMQWDYALHFHHHPWQLLQPLLGHPLVTTFLARIYGCWFFVLAGTIVWQANSSERFYRMQFFLTFLAAWIILGTACAYYFSSAGPCYYSYFSHDTVNPYAPLMTYLNAHAPAWLLGVQNALLIHLMENTLIFGGGVSAMPSMHLSMATLCFLIMSKQNKWLGLAALVFLLLILLGSIHLAWHYAVDGYAAILVTTLIWYCTGQILRYAGPEKVC